MGLLIAGAIIGFSINIVTADENLTKVSKFQFSRDDPLMDNSTKLDIVLSQTSDNSLGSKSSQIDFLGPIFKGATNSIVNFFGIIIFFGALGLILYVHLYARAKHKLYQQTNAVLRMRSANLSQFNDHLYLY